MSVPDRDFHRSLEAIRSMPEVLLPEERKKLTIKDVKKNGYVLIDGLVYKVDQFNRYTAGADDWFELKLKCINNLNVAFLEWEVDDDLEVSLWTEKLKLRDLPITDDDLEKFDDEERGSFSFRGDKYEYEDSDDALFHENNEKDWTDKIYYYEFEGPGKKLLSVEEWLADNGEDVRETDVRVGHSIEPYTVEVLITGGD